MLKKILVALNDSTTSAIVFDYALTLAHTLNAQLMLLHVLAADETGHPLTEFHHSPEWEAQLQAYVQQAKATGIDAEFTQSYGDPAQIICDWAWSWKAELLVLGRQEQSETSGWRMGRVDRYVHQHSPCSVLLVSVPHKQNSPAPDYELVEVP